MVEATEGEEQRGTYTVDFAGCLEEVGCVNAVFKLPKGVGTCNCGKRPKPAIVQILNEAMRMYENYATIQCECGKMVSRRIYPFEDKDSANAVMDFSILLTTEWNSSLARQFFEHNGPKNTLPVKCHLVLGALAEHVSETLQTRGADQVLNTGKFNLLIDGSDSIELALLQLDPGLLGQITASKLVGEAWSFQPTQVKLRDCSKKLHLCLSNSQAYIYLFCRPEETLVRVLLICKDQDSAIAANFRKFSGAFLSTFGSSY